MKISISIQNVQILLVSKKGEKTQYNAYLIELPVANNEKLWQNIIMLCALYSTNLIEEKNYFSLHK